jgi:CRP/FNR family cyclic AMP-dependent transcriptional regulator
MNFLRTVQLFSELEDSDLLKLEALGERKKYEEGSTILREGDPGSAMFVVITGKVKVVRIEEEGNEVILAILGEGEFFGEMAILDGHTRSATVVTIDDSELFVLSQNDVIQLLHDFPAIAISLLKEFAVRLRKANTQIKGLSLKDAAGKVAGVILRLADEFGFFTKGAVEITELPVQQDMASMAGTSRETVSRILQMFVEQGYVTLRGRKLVINDFEKFKNMYF